MSRNERDRSLLRSIASEYRNNILLSAGIVVGAAAVAAYGEASVSVEAGEHAATIDICLDGQPGMTQLNEDFRTCLAAYDVDTATLQKPEYTVGNAVSVVEGVRDENYAEAEDFNVVRFAGFAGASSVALSFVAAIGTGGTFLRPER